MRRAAYKLGFLMMIVGLMGVYGCGSSDILDEVGQRYIASLQVLELDEATLQVDTVQDVCGTGNSTTPEDFSDALGEITITAAANTAGLTLQSYTLEYIPLGSVDQLGTSRMPPDITDPPSDGATTVDIPPNSTRTFTITLISTTSKAEYNVKLGLDPALVNLSTSRYLIRVIMHFKDTAGNDRDIAVDKTVYFSDYDHC